MNIKKILSAFWNWIFAGVTFLGFAIIYAGIGGDLKYNPTGDTNWYFFGIGVILILPFVFYITNLELWLKKTKDENAERIKKLIKYGEKVSVDLDKLKIKTNSYQQEISVGGGYRQGNEYIDVNHNAISLEIPYRNELIKYKLNIYMDPTKLKMHFAIMEKTDLYVDPQNPNNNYLDLRFLKS